MKQSVVKKLATCVSASAVMASLAAPAWAQDSASSTDDASAVINKSADDKQIEAIIVTGSRIRGVAPVGSNVIAIGTDEIAREPVTSTNDLLRRVPQVVSLGANRNGGTAQNGAANATRGAGINLRGISTNATLLLYDGKRFPPQGTQGQYTDPSVIPAIALERVEVVADGASAIYGSDAIAGVVNFIMRKNFDGVEVRGRLGMTDSKYAEQQIAGVIGKTWNGGSAMIAAEFTHNSALRGYDLDWYQDDNRARGGRDLRTTNCDPGTLSVGGTTYAIPQGGLTAANAGTLVPGTSNKCFLNAQDTVIPKQNRYNVVGNISQDLTPDIRLFADGFYSYRDGTIAGVNTINATVPSTNPFFVSPVAGASSVSVAYSLVPTVGPDFNPYHGSSWNLMGGIEARPFGDWRATVYYAHGESEDVADRRLGINSGALAVALADTDPATALNVFGGPNNPATIAAIRDRLFVITGKTRLDVVNAQMDGSLFELPGGAARLAVGAEYRKEYTFTDLEIGSSVSAAHIADGGSRNVKAVFGELFVPVVGAGNAMSGIEQLSLSLAGRYEKYSDFGHTSNPKIGLTYKPVDAVTIRGSYGTSFRAPTFTEVSTVAGGAGLYYDLLPGPAGNQRGIGIAGGNPDLKPETATTWSVGGDIAPVRGLRATLTYFHIDYKNQIQALRGTPGLLTNPLYSSFVILNPSAAQVQDLIASGLPINAPIDETNVTFIADGRRQNLGRSVVAGLDFGVYLDWAIGAVQFDASAQGTYFSKYDFESVPGAGLTGVRGTINFPQKFRSQADLGARFGKFSARIVWNHLDGYENNTVTPVQKVSSYDTFDVNLGVDVTSAFHVGLDVRNLFDRDPPFVDTQRGHDPQSANPVPRLISMTAGVKF
ncbi:TonB-dependent receptor [Novosphingobium sp. PP1Y]|uniref:TonB-dependent receptor n=1 Tax=Novosphingobium sp. PP1Y TaxID=702113 RepID=UPI0002DFB9D6|nr:TonB-dependent receptor [Novosphingobium sp. PP1Y]